MPRLFITIILLLGSVLLGLFYLGPNFTHFRTLQKEVADLRNISAELDELIENRDALLDLINSVSRGDLGRIGEALPQGANSSEFLVTLEALAKRNNLVLRRVDLASPQEAQTRGGQPKPGGISNPPAPATVKELPISMSVAGSYESFKQFLAELERNLRIADVESLSFTSPALPAQFEFSIRGKTYYQ